MMVPCMMVFMQGTVTRGRRRGRQKKRWEDNIREWAGLELRNTSRKAEDKQEWKAVVKRSSAPRRIPNIRHSKCLNHLIVQLIVDSQYRLILLGCTEATCNYMRASPTPRIIGGTASRRGEFPWVAMLLKDGAYHCVCNIMDENHCLTAAHCFQS
ncbi:transmembrane protease serine [Plakobranchus ocellatus]|uniref:Transmembrane protease serine n=1 Tax=Plakobranchus ocellatus TaxID=259542 RepID=A0AAV3YAZ2_9GAST|nr:transmembrane protease serine [Plakobranchus ocellatus]